MSKPKRIRERSTPKGTKALSTGDPDLAIKHLYRHYQAEVSRFTCLPRRSPEDVRDAIVFFNDYIMHRAALGFVKPPKEAEWSKLVEWRDAMKVMNDAHLAAALLIRARLQDDKIDSSPVMAMARQTQHGKVDPDVKRKCDGLLDQLEAIIAGDSAEPQEGPPKSERCRDESKPSAGQAHTRAIQDDPASTAALGRVRTMLHTFGHALRALPDVPDGRIAADVLQRCLAEFSISSARDSETDAIRRCFTECFKSSADDWESETGLPFPRTLDELEFLAARCGHNLDEVSAGNWTPAEWFPGIRGRLAFERVEKERRAESKTDGGVSPAEGDGENAAIAGVGQGASQSDGVADLPASAKDLIDRISRSHATARDLANVINRDRTIVNAWLGRSCREHRRKVDDPKLSSKWEYDIKLIWPKFSRYMNTPR